MGASPGFAVSIRDLHVVRGDVTVLDGLSLDIPAHRIIGLLGPSGCGKSTLMRTIVGVQKVASGTVTVLGQPAGSADLRRRIGYVTQAPSVYTDLTVTENLEYFAHVLGAGKGDIDTVLDRADLRTQASMKVGRLSGGQRSRVSLAAALLGGPEFLVLDEPTVGQDPVLRRDLWALFRQIADDGATLLVSSHVMDEAARCDSLLLMRQGAMLADGTLAELCERTGAADAEGVFLALIDAANNAGPGVGA